MLHFKCKCFQERDFRYVIDFSVAFIHAFFSLCPTQDASVTPHSSGVEDGWFELLFLQSSVCPQSTALHQHHRGHWPAGACSLSFWRLTFKRRFALKLSIHQCLADQVAPGCTLDLSNVTL